jgi:archaellum component FlaC
VSAEGSSKKLKMNESPEWLINDLNGQIEKLKVELETAQKDIADFEKLAIVWRKGHQDLENKYRVEIGNLKQTIEELEKELKDG